MANCDETNRISGFTPIEVLVVLVIIGIISVMIIGRSDIGQTNLLAQTEVIKSHIRYAQSRAMNSDQTWGIRCDAPGQSYWLFIVDAPTNQKRKLPGQASDTVSLSAYGLTLTPTTLSFDDRGRPCSDDKGTMVRGSDLTLTLSTINGENKTITVTRNTGFVP